MLHLLLGLYVVSGPGFINRKSRRRVESRNSYRSPDIDLAPDYISSWARYGVNLGLPQIRYNGIALLVVEHRASDNLSYRAQKLTGCQAADLPSYELRLDTHYARDSYKRLDFLCHVSLRTLNL